MDETDAAFVSASPVNLVAVSDSNYETAAAVKSDFALGGISNGVIWTSSNPGVISISDGNATVEGDGSTVLTATLGGVSKSVTLTVPDMTAPMLMSAVRDSNTQITVELSEACKNLGKSNDGGFIVTKTGTSATYAVTATTQGADSSHVVLTVNDMGTAAGTGVTVTYFSDANGTVAD